jgi:hypothetical protein
MEWEEIECPGHSGYFWRSRTPTGWLVRESLPVSRLMPDKKVQSSWDFTATLAFVPDPDGLWLASGTAGTPNAGGAQQNG